MSSTHDGTAIFETQDYQKPTKAESLCYQAFANILHLQHQLASVINNEDFENAYPQIENALDRLNSTTILMEAHEEAKKSSELCPHEWIGTLHPDVQQCRHCPAKRDFIKQQWKIRPVDLLPTKK